MYEKSACLNPPPPKKTKTTTRSLVPYRSHEKLIQINEYINFAQGYDCMITLIRRGKSPMVLEKTIFKFR